MECGRADGRDHPPATRPPAQRPHPPGWKSVSVSRDLDRRGCRNMRGSAAGGWQVRPGSRGGGSGWRPAGAGAGRGMARARGDACKPCAGGGCQAPRCGGRGRAAAHWLPPAGRPRTTPGRRPAPASLQRGWVRSAAWSAGAGAAQADAGEAGARGRAAQAARPADGRASEAGGLPARRAARAPPAAQPPRAPTRIWASVYVRSTGTRRSVISTTTPKLFPPPPQCAAKRLGCVRRSTATRRPRASTMRSDSSWSQARPCRELR